jgi:hypothetical protein
MAATESRLKRFILLLVRFTDDVADTYPEYTQIKQLQRQLELARRGNPRMLLDMFHQLVVVHLRDEILKPEWNEDAMLGTAKRIATAETAGAIEQSMLSNIFGIVEKEWADMSAPNRTSISNYVRALVRLADEEVQEHGIKYPLAAMRGELMSSLSTTVAKA